MPGVVRSRLTRGIVEKDLGVEILSRSEMCSATIVRSIEAVKDLVDADDYEWYRKQCGKITGYVFTNLMEPVYWQHPELEPQELKARPSEEQS